MERWVRRSETSVGWGLEAVYFVGAAGGGGVGGWLRGKLERSSKVASGTAGRISVARSFSRRRMRAACSCWARSSRRLGSGSGGGAGGVRENDDGKSVGAALDGDVGVDEEDFFRIPLGFGRGRGLGFGDVAGGGSAMPVMLIR